MITFRKTVVASVLLAGLTLAGCSSNSNPTTTSTPGGSSSVSSSPAAPKVFPFKVGTVDWEDFSKEVGTANQAIKTLHVRNINEVTVAGKTTTSTAEGDIDQTDANKPSYNVKMTEGEKGAVVTEAMSVDGVLYLKRSGEGWLKYPQAMMVNPISTSTSLFSKLSEIEGAVKEVKYVEKDATGHKFTMKIDMSKLIPNSIAAAKVGDVTTTFWLNDSLQLVKQELIIKSEQGTSKVLSEQSKFNEPVKLEAPKDAKEVNPSGPTEPASPAPAPSAPASPSSGN